MAKYLFHQHRGPWLNLSFKHLWCSKLTNVVEFWAAKSDSIGVQCTVTAEQTQVQDSKLIHWVAVSPHIIQHTAMERNKRKFTMAATTYTNASMQTLDLHGLKFSLMGRKLRLLESGHSFVDQRTGGLMYQQNELVGQTHNTEKGTLWWVQWCLPQESTINGSLVMKVSIVKV